MLSDRFCFLPAPKERKAIRPVVSAFRVTKVRSEHSLMRQNSHGAWEGSGSPHGLRATGWPTRTGFRRRTEVGSPAVMEGAGVGTAGRRAWGRVPAGLGPDAPDRGVWTMSCGQLAGHAQERWDKDAFEAEPPGRCMGLGRGAPGDTDQAPVHREAQVRGRTAHSKGCRDHLRRR